MKRVTFLIDEKRDRDIVRWLDEKAASQEKSAAIRTAIRAAMNQPEITLVDIYQEIQELKRSGITRIAADSEENISGEAKHNLLGLGIG